MGMCNGSTATVIYASTGDAGLAKERIEVHAGGRSAVIDDFRRVELWHRGKKAQKSWMSQDKGQSTQVKDWISGLQQGRSPIPVAEIFNVHAACLGALQSMPTGAVINL
jgi:polar amino acid transport system substrate-binding protein